MRFALSMMQQCVKIEGTLTFCHTAFQPMYFSATTGFSLCLFQPSYFWSMSFLATAAQTSRTVEDDRDRGEK